MVENAERPSKPVGQRAWSLARTRSRAILLAAALVLVPPLGIGGWAGALQLTGNIHEIEPGALYRSAQLNGQALGDVLKRYGIRTVINLRGAHDGAKWYEDERARVQAAGVGHLDIRMSATHEPDAATRAALIEALRTAPRPLLIHCKSGADRTGFAAAVYELLVAGRPKDQAAGQLSFRYGHFPWLTSRTGAMDRAFEEIAAAPGSP